MAIVLPQDRFGCFEAPACGTSAQFLADGWKEVITGFAQVATENDQLGRQGEHERTDTVCQMRTEPVQGSQRRLIALVRGCYEVRKGQAVTEPCASRCLLRNG